MTGEAPPEAQQPMTAEQAVALVETLKLGLAHELAKVFGMSAEEILARWESQQTD